MYRQEWADVSREEQVSDMPLGYLWAFKIMHIRLQTLATRVGNCSEAAVWTASPAFPVCPAEAKNLIGAALKDYDVVGGLSHRHHYQYYHPSRHYPCRRHRPP